MSGHVLAIAGPMFSSKSTSLIAQLRRATIAKRSVVLFKPVIDNRYSVDEVVSHDGDSLPAIVIKSSDEVLDLVGNASIVAFDEFQFMDKGILEVIYTLSKQGKNVVIAGLSSDFMGNAFEITARAMALADNVNLLSAVCMKCGENAKWTQMVVDGVEITTGDRIHIGGLETFEPRCTTCFVRS